MGRCRLLILLIPEVLQVFVLQRFLLCARAVGETDDMARSGSAKVASCEHVIPGHSWKGNPIC